MKRIIEFFCGLLGGHYFRETGWGFDTKEDISHIKRSCVYCSKEEIITVGDSRVHEARYMTQGGRMTFTLEEIKKAFWDYFDCEGDVYFGEPKHTIEHWDDFLKTLTEGISELRREEEEYIKLMAKPFDSVKEKE